MNSKADLLSQQPWLIGVKEAFPLLGGYVPVAISFGLIAMQSGFNVWETILISTLIYAGASQFLFVAMVASGAPLWLVVIMTLLINARHLVYGPNLAPYLSKSPVWIGLMHGLTDQIFALALTRLPQLHPSERLGWFSGAAVLAWLSWVGGTMLGAMVGGELIARWPLLAQVLPFALPALFLVLLAPRFNSRIWAITLVTTTIVAIIIKLVGFDNAAILLAALCGALLYYTVKDRQPKGNKNHG
jgi:4-azaleucine resistance transporter AzlC